VDVTIAGVRRAKDQGEKMLPTVKSEKSDTPPVLRKEPARVLIVEDEPTLVEIIHDILRREIGCTVSSAPNIEEAERALLDQQVDLVITDVNLPDGNGMNLLPSIQKNHPTASAIIITGAPSVEGAISAIRHGAVDFLPKPFDTQQLIDRIRKALDRQAVVAKEERRFDRLKEAVKRLNASRRVISKKVDLLCNDLVAAYGELSKQLDGVRTQEGFRKYIETAKDLEQLLCHAMDWLLRQMGYCNVAVWLTAEDGEFQLGAYMKYTAPGEPILTDAMKRVILPLAVRDTQVHISGDELQEKFTPQEAALYKGQDILAVNCTYLGDSLAALVFFRDAKSPFENEFESLLKQVSPIFAVALASVVRGTEHEAEYEDQDVGPFIDKNEDRAPGGTAGPEEEPKQDNTKKRPKEDPADWWKRGDMPPF
jgi:FixJ family two-component response regulator